MDRNELKEIMYREHEALGKLLLLLEEQHDLLIQNDILKLEEIVNKIELCNKDIAQAEIDRRKLVNGGSMKDIIYELKDEELDGIYRKVNKLIHSLSVQKETNDMLIKLGLGFSNKMLNIINPDRTQKTYNSYGKLRR